MFWLLSSDKFGCRARQNPAFVLYFPFVVFKSGGEGCVRLCALARNPSTVALITSTVLVLTDFVGEGISDRDLG